MPERLITRPQQLLRSFFGLGPDQFAFSDVLSGTLDVDALMRSPQDTQILFQTSAAIAPGAAGTIALQMPTQGGWFVHGVSISSTGPATSGNFRLGIRATFTAPIWGIGGSLSLTDKFDLLPRIGGTQAVHVGRWFDKPLVLYRNNAGNFDTVEGLAFNDAGSVGNLTATLHVFCRPLGRLLST